MQIDDLTAGLSLSFLINLNTEQLQFESKILEVYPRRHTLLAQGVFTDDKIISFRGKGLVVDLIVTLPEDKPQLFKNVTTHVVKLSDGTLCYTVSSIAGSKTTAKAMIIKISILFSLPLDNQPTNMVSYHWHKASIRRITAPS